MEVKQIPDEVRHLFLDAKRDSRMCSPTFSIDNREEEIVGHKRTDNAHILLESIFQEKM